MWRCRRRAALLSPLTGLTLFSIIETRFSQLTRVRVLSVAVN